MYITKTTAKERLIIGNAVDSQFDYVMRARRLLMKVLDDFFNDAEQKAICTQDAEDIGDILHAVNDALWWAETEYSLTVGDELAPGCESSYEGARRAALVREVEQLRSKIGYEAAGEYVDMDDEMALPYLKAIAKDKGVKVDG